MFEWSLEDWFIQSRRHQPSVISYKDLCDERNLIAHPSIDLAIAEKLCNKLLETDVSLEDYSIMYENIKLQKKNLYLDVSQCV